jgi:hypothetical protein
MTYRQLHQDQIVAADLWADEPLILSAGLGFDGIIGVDGGEAEVRAAGGTWNTVTCTSGDDPPRGALTSSATTTNVMAVYDHPAAFADGLPVVFSWPIQPTTLARTDFRVTLNTGDTLRPDAASIFPNFEYNERHVAVIFGDFGNRLTPDQEGSRYPTRVEVVADDTPLMLIGPEGPVSAVGLFWEGGGSPYESGPYLVGAKLSQLSDEGEGGPLFLNATQPNDGISLYGATARYRLRMFTTGGFSPDGVRGILPTEFSRFFRLHVRGAGGEDVLVTETDVDYAVEGGSLRVLGLADLGRAEGGGPQGATYDDCYVEDHDNYIDVILRGDEAAMRAITTLEIPATGDYDPLYNPGGPGNNPSEGVTYTAPGPPDLEPVIIALDDPGTVDFGD